MNAVSLLSGERTTLVSGGAASIGANDHSINNRIILAVLSIESNVQIYPDSTFIRRTIPRESFGISIKQNLISHQAFIPPRRETPDSGFYIFAISGIDSGFYIFVISGIHSGFYIFAISGINSFYCVL
jgi:hypothetical protein